jgi:hypothetical protein
MTFHFSVSLNLETQKFQGMLDIRRRVWGNSHAVIGQNFLQRQGSEQGHYSSGEINL